MDKIRKDGRVNCSTQGLPDIEAIGPFNILAYTAAFVDGFGSFSMTSGANSPSISVYNNNPQVLKNIMPVIGGGLHQNFRKEWQLRIGSIPGCKAICELLLPKLITKRKQAELILKACLLAKADRTPVNLELSATNKKKDYVRPPDTVALKIATTKDSSDWSYFGGYVDTDSNIELQPQTHGLTTYYYPHFNIYCKNPEPLLWLQKRFGGQFLSRKRDGKWISSLEFEDQVHVIKMLEILKPYVLDKKETIDIVLDACKFDSKDRAAAANKLKRINDRFHGLHKFEKTDDGKYIDRKRSPTSPHMTHKGVPFKDCKSSPVREIDRTEDGDFVTIRYDDGSTEKMTHEELRLMKSHFDEKYLKQEYYSNCSDPLEAKSLVTGKKFIDVIEGWANMAQKDIEQALFDDWDKALADLERKQNGEEGSDKGSGAVA